MDEKTIHRADRIAKVAEAFPRGDSSLVIVNDRTGALQRIEGERWNRFSVSNRSGLLWPEKKYEEALIRLDVNKSAMRLLLQGVNAVLPPSSPIWIIGGNDEGIKSFGKTAEGLITDIQTVEIKKRCRLLKARSVESTLSLSSYRQSFEVELGGVSRKWCYYPGSFSKGGIDLGTQLLLKVLEKIQIPEGKQIADFACGTGIIAALLRQLFPQAHIDAIEADAWAMEATKENVPDVVHLLSDGWRKVPLDRRYRLIVSNPPVHIGKEQDFSILRRLLQGAQQRLHRKGELVLVLQGQVALHRLIGTLYRKCEVLQENKRYKVWRISAPSR